MSEPIIPGGIGCREVVELITAAAELEQRPDAAALLEAFRGFRRH
jgi:hypothetical protein